MIRLTVVFRDDTEAQALVKGWDLKDNGDIYIVESDDRHRAIAAGMWAEVISTREQA